MSTELLADGGLFLTRFYGGEKHGECYQITVSKHITGGRSDADEYETYIQLTRPQMEAIITALVADRLGAKTGE